MNSMYAIGMILVTIVLLKYVFKIDVKKAKELNQNPEIEKITDRFPDNIEIAKEMLEMIDNKNVKIEELKNTQTSLYIAITNKILIADLKNNYARIQTIAHECMHSIQDRRMLMFNFIFSNVFIIFWITMCILTITRVTTHTWEITFMLLLCTMIKIVIRGYLETDAMLKSRYLAEQYIKQKNITSKEETEKILKKYDEINSIGVPFTIVRILLGSLIGILIFLSITLFMARI